MPKATCPACQTDVRYSADAEVGDTATCPECDEVFVPPKLRKKVKKYRPEDEDTYKVGRAESDADERDKNRKVGALMRGVARRAREKKTEPERSLIGGPEIVLLVFALMATAGLGIGFVIAKRAPAAGEAVGIMLVYGIGMVVFAVRLARARRNLGG
jgi:Zn-finger nucleic acid-binding protein